jgi:hypothetical protein
MKKILNFIILLSFLGCDEKTENYFYISNGSQDQSEIPLRLIVDTDTVFDKKAKYTNIAPDLQYIERLKLNKGKHKVIFEVPNTNLSKTEIIEFNKDKWIFVSYDYKAPTDSLTRTKLDKKFKNIRNADSVFSKLYNGRKPSLIIYVMENKPIHH